MNPGIHAAIAAAEQRRQEEEEEERMTRYDNQELDSDWEFKIVRSNTGLFRNPDALRRVIEEEAVSGWQLLEKLDNNRVRFKRRANARQKDFMLPKGVDPYRTSVGGSPAALVLVLGVIFLFMTGGLVFVLTSRGDTSVDGTPYILLSVVGLIVVLAVLKSLIRR